MSRLLILTLSGTLAGCAATSSNSGPLLQPLSGPTLPLRATNDRVMGRDATALIALFGQPTADVTEGKARKLQFVGKACVLDAYLYAKGTTAPVVTYVEARQPDGTPVNNASCVGTLTRRGK